MKANHKTVSQILKDNTMVLSEIEEILLEMSPRDLLLMDRKSRPQMIETLTKLNHVSIY